MPTWTVTTQHTHQTGDADTSRLAWDAAYAAAADTARARVLQSMRLEVIGEPPATIAPAASGDELADIEATLKVIEDSRRAMAAAYQGTQ
jgi:hypothetical protein